MEWVVLILGGLLAVLAWSLDLPYERSYSEDGFSLRSTRISPRLSDYLDLVRRDARRRNIPVFVPPDYPESPSHWRRAVLSRRDLLRHRIALVTLGIWLWVSFILLQDEFGRGRERGELPSSAIVLIISLVCAVLALRRLFFIRYVTQGYLDGYADGCVDTRERK